MTRSQGHRQNGTQGMSSNDVTAGSYPDEAISGLCTSVAALVVALDDAGMLSRTRFDDILKQLWVGMPAEEGEGGAGAVIETILTQVRHSAASCPRPTAGNAGETGSGTAGSVIETNDNTPGGEPMRVNGRRSKHTPLLGAPFVV